MPARRNVVTLSAPERAALVAAIKAMKTRPDPDGVASNVYDKYVLQHSLTMRTPSPPNTDPNVCNMAHRGPSFCPWHREFLRRFEQDLGMPLPYWDWAQDQASGSPQTAPVWGNDLMGPNGNPTPDPATSRPAQAVTQGPFAHDPADPNSWSIVQDPGMAPDPTVPWLTRDFGAMQPTLPTPQDVTAAMAVTPYDSAPWNVTSQGFRNFLEGFIGPGLHNIAHMWVGGSMMPSTSPNDPVFFLHHANVDRIWANWQRQWLNAPQGAYLPVTGGPTGHNLADGMFPWGAPSTPQSVLDTFALGYWYDDAVAPSVSALVPAAGAGAGGTIVTISGVGFMGAVTVSFGATPAVTFNVDNDAQITALSPAGTGMVNVTVTTPVGVSATGAATQFTYGTLAPPPIVTGISPTTGSTGGGDTVTITGAGFTGASTVNFGPSAAGFNIDADTQITAVSPPGNAGTVDITVTTANGSSSASTADQFTYVIPPPAVTGLNPANGAPAGGTQVVITGTSLTGGTAVMFGATAAAAFSIDSDTQITATSPAGTGTVDVTVTTAAGTSATGPADKFNYAATGAPQVTGLNPANGSTAGGESVVITGTAFTGASGVAFGPSPAASFNVDSDTQITAKSPSGNGTVDVTVTTPAGTSAVNAADQFTYQVTVPVITGLNPANGAAAGGDSVVVTGTGLTGATAVTFGANPAASFSVDSSTQITAVSPAGAGTVDVIVTTPAGASATGPADQFTYNAPVPQVTGVNPASGSSIGGDQIVISGAGFTGATVVSFGSNAAAFNVDNDTQITATSPAGSGTVDITVTTPAGTSAIGPSDQFTYIGSGLPQVMGVNPSMGSAAGGDNVVITGVGFTDATDVNFGSNSASLFSVDSDTQISASSPAGFGTVDITVTTPIGTSLTVAADQFSYM